MTRNETFLKKSHGDYSKVEKPVLVTTNYEGLDEEEELDMVPVVNQNKYNNNVISDSERESYEDEAEKNLFEQQHQ